MVLWLEDEQEAAEARKALRAMAQKKLSHWSYHDREDLIQDAMMKALGQRRLPGEAPLIVRARVTFFDELRDAHRRAARRAEREDLVDELPATEFEEARASSFLELADDCAALLEMLGPELTQFALLRARGFSFVQIAALDGWDERRVDNARTQLRRKQALVAGVFNQDIRRRKEAS